MSQASLVNVLDYLKQQQPDTKTRDDAEGFVLPWTFPLGTVNIALTGRCNLRCPCCYKDLNGREIPVDRMLYTVDQLHEAGWVTTLMLAGGEPMLYKGLYDVIARASGYGMKVYLGTNGTLLKDKNVQKLADAGVSEVYIGVDPGLVQNPDKDPRAYEKTIKAFGRLKAHGVHAMANLIVTHQNLKILPQMVDTLLSEGADGVNLLRPKPQKTGRWFEDTRLTWKDMAKLQQIFLGLRAKRTPAGKKIDLRTECALGMLLEGIPSDILIEQDPAPTCAAAFDYCSIEQDGTILPCPYLKGRQFEMGNIVTDNLAEVWRDGRNWQQLRAPREYSGACGECYLKDQCGGCRAVALHEGDLNQEDPDCPRAHETKVARVWRHTRFWTKVALTRLR